MTTFRSLCWNIWAQMANEQERQKCKPYVWQMEFLLNLLAEERRDAVFLKAPCGAGKTAIFSVGLLLLIEGFGTFYGPISSDGHSYLCAYTCFGQWAHCQDPRVWRPSLVH